MVPMAPMAELDATKLPFGENATEKTIDFNLEGRTTEAGEIGFEGPIDSDVTSPFVISKCEL